MPKWLVWLVSPVPMFEELKWLLNQIPVPYRYVVVTLYFAVGFYVGMRLHAHLWRFRAEVPRELAEHPAVFPLTTAVARHAAFLFGLILWPFTPLVIGSGKLIIRVLGRKIRKANTERT